MGRVSTIDYGFYFVAAAPNGGAYVMSKIATLRYAVLEVSAADVLALWTSTGQVPRLGSARIVIVRGNRKDCVMAFESMSTGGNAPDHD